MTDTEKQERLEHLLEGTKLQDAILDLFEQKNISARITKIYKLGHYIVIYLHMYTPEKQLVIVYLYIPLEVLEEDYFKQVDRFLPADISSINNRILLRVLRIVFSVCRIVCGGKMETQGLDTNKAVTARVDENGMIEYRSHE